MSLCRCGDSLRCLSQHNGDRRGRHNARPTGPRRASLSPPRRRFLVAQASGGWRARHAMRANPPVFGSPGPAGRQSVGPVGPTVDRPRRWSNHPRGAREPWSCHLPVDRFLTCARGLRLSRSLSRRPSTCVKILPDMSTTLACDFPPLGRAATNSWCCFRSPWQPRAFPGGSGMS